MHTTCSPHCMCFSSQPPVVSALGEVLNKFEQVSSLGYQMSVRQGRALYRRWPGLRGRKRVSCTVRSNASWEMITWEPPENRQTDMTENIAFPQLRWWTVLNQRIIYSLTNTSMQNRRAHSHNVEETIEESYTD